MKYILLICLLISCKRGHVIKVRVLESGTVTLCDVTASEAYNLTVGDTIWVDLEKHILDDTCSTAIKAVITN